MWDSIQPTDEWLQAQLPPLLRGPLSRLMAGEGGGAPHADYEALAQASDWGGANCGGEYVVRFGPIKDRQSWIRSWLFEVVACHAHYDAPGLHTCLQAHTACVAGACLAVGIRFAGSANARAEALLRRYAQHLLAAKQRVPEPGTGGCVGARVGTSVTGSCLVHCM